MENYREKIYKTYSNNSGRDLAPNALDGLISREPFFNNIIKKYFPVERNVRILEIGCGHGSFGYFIQKLGYKNYIGIDGSKSQVEAAKRLGIKNIILGDLTEYLRILDNSSLDLLLAIDVIEHFKKEELSDLIDEINRVLKKGGTFITHQPNAESPFEGSIRYGDFTHELSFTKASISQIFLSSKFSQVVSYEDKPLAHGVKSSIRLFFWSFLVKPIYKFLLIVESGGGDMKNTILTKNFLTIIKK
jgi:SAM-dependent methyltransferase